MIRLKFSFIIHLTTLQLLQFHLFNSMLVPYMCSDSFWQRGIMYKARPVPRIFDEGCCHSNIFCQAKNTWVKFDNYVYISQLCKFSKYLDRLIQMSHNNLIFKNEVHLFEKMCVDLLTRVGGGGATFYILGILLAIPCES